MREIGWRLAALVAAGTMLVAVGCGDSGDEDGGEGGDTSTEATATEALTATGTATEAVTETATATEATPAPTEAGPSLADYDGLACSGKWRNETFGSTGSFAATFDVGEDGGSVRLELGGNVFGAQGGEVDVPLSADGEALVIDADLGFLGQAMLNFEGAELQEGVLNSPPALGEGSKVTVTDFAFDGETLTFGVDIEFANNGGTARSVVEATCG